jgi:hypothetical protein
MEHGTGIRRSRGAAWRACFPALFGPCWLRPAAELHSNAADQGAAGRGPGDLEAAGVREDRAIPTHEIVQVAGSPDGVAARPQHEVEGVAEQDLHAGCPQLVRGQAAHRGHGPHGHEGGGFGGPAAATELQSTAPAVSLSFLKGTMLELE